MMRLSSISYSPQSPWGDRNSPRADSDHEAAQEANQKSYLRSGSFDIGAETIEGEGYVQIEELTKDLDRRESEAVIIRADVDRGEKVRVEFLSDFPIDMSIKGLTYRKKVNRATRSSFTEFGTAVSILDHFLGDDMDIIDHVNATKWRKDYTSDELQDIHASASLPKGISRAKVNIRISVHQRGAL
jgi:hypothetical protein